MSFTGIHIRRSQLDSIYSKLTIDSRPQYGHFFTASVRWDAIHSLEPIIAILQNASRDPHRGEVIKQYADLIRRIVQSSDSWMHEIAPAPIIAAMSAMSQQADSMDASANLHMTGLHDAPPPHDLIVDDDLWLVSLCLGELMACS